MQFQPKTSGFADRVRQNFDQQTAMHSMDMTLTCVEPGLVEIEMAYSEKFTQQHGFVHAGVITTGMDTACGYSAFTLMAETAEVLTVEFKSNFLRPARGEKFRFIGTVLKAGKSITVTEGKAYALEGGKPDTLVASMSATMMAVTS